MKSSFRNVDPVGELGVVIDEVIQLSVLSAAVELEDRRLFEMRTSLVAFVVDAVDKYVAGQKEHGGDLCDRDLEKELRMERIDEFWYGEARGWKKRREKQYESSGDQGGLHSGEWVPEIKVVSQKT